MKALKVYEKLDFERGQDPKHSMKIGQDYIKQILIDLFPKRKPGERDYELHQNLINDVILRPTFIFSIDKENNIIRVKNQDKGISFSPFESLFDVMIDHINLYSFPLQPKIARIVDPMAAAKGMIELKILKE
jgi:hypothetical protein